jgi:hypothetical protein
MSPHACYGCPDNPRGKEKTEEKQDDEKLIELYWPDIDLAQRFYHAARLGLLTISDLRETEFQHLSAFAWEWERQSRGA